jgi:hypothetical protein
MVKLIMEKVVRGGSVLGYTVTDYESKKEVFHSMDVEPCLEYIKTAMLEA